MDQATHPPRGAKRAALLAVVAALAIVLALATRASAAPDPSLCTVVTQSGSPSSESVEGVSTAYSPDGSRLYTLGNAYPTGSVLTTLDAGTGNVTRTLALPEQGQQVVVDPVSGRVFVRGANPQGPTQEGVLWVVDPSGSTVIATVAEGYGLGDLVPDPAGGTVYAVRYASVGVGELIAIAPDGSTTRNQALVRTPSGALAYDPLGDDLLVGFIGGGADIQRFAAATFAPGATGPVATAIGEPEHLRIAPALGRLYALRGYQYLQVIDLSTLTVISQKDLGFGPYDFGVDPFAEVLYASAAPEQNQVKNFLKTFDASTGAPLRSDRWGIDQRGFGVRTGGGVAITSRSEVSQVVQGDCAPSDDVAPTVSVSAPAEGAEVALYSQHAVVATCADSGSGLAGLNLYDRWTSHCLTDSDGVPSETGTSLDTSSPGTKSITVRARDNAGNETSVTRHYTVVAPPDETAPTIDITTPLIPSPWPGYGEAYDVPGPQPFTLDQHVVLDFSCYDGAYESGVAACDASVNGVPVQNGDPLPTDTPGLKTVHVVTRDVAGNVATLDRQYRVLAGERSESSVGGPQLLTTDPGGLGATARVPVQTDVLLTKFAGGALDIVNASSQAPPAGLTALSGAPALRVRFPGRDSDPVFFSRVRFRLDSSILPASPDLVRLVRNGTEVPSCTAPSTPSPDPCVKTRTIGPDGDLTLEVVMLAGDEPSPIGVTYDAVWSFALAPASGPPDVNPADGIADILQPAGTPSGSFSDDTGNGKTTTGQIVSSGGLTVAVEDVADPKGVRIITSGPGGPAVLSVCPAGFELDIPAATSLVVTCGSVTVDSVSGGPVTITLPGGLTSVSVPAGSGATVDTTAGGGFSITNVSGTVALSVDGVSRPISGPVSGKSWRFVGFSQPVDGGGVLNAAKAGQAIPLKWRVLDANGAPVTSLTSATITAQNLACTAGTPVDDMEELAAGASDLKNLGNGNYQLNWKSPTSYANSCKTLKLDIGDGVTHNALFKLK